MKMSNLVTSPNVEGNRHRLGMDRLDHRIGLGRQEAVDKMRPRYWLGLGAAVTLELGPDAREREQLSLLVEREPHHIFLPVSGFGSGAYSAKLFAGTKQRFSGFSHIRQCGDEVLRMFVTGALPIRGGDGMPSAS
jgi:hypothetical protein